MNLESKIEAILFYKGESVSAKKLSEYLKVTEDEINQAITNIKASESGKGIVLVEVNNEIALGTSPELGELIEGIQKEEINKELSKASLETLSIILYKNGASRAEIDYIRGVNSSFTLRALSVRGLIEKISDPSDNRKYLYRPTLDLISHLGMTNIEELPEYQNVFKNLTQAEQSLKENTEEA